MLIDFHTHAFPEGLAQRAMSSLTITAGMTPYTDGTVGDLEKSAEQSGVSHFVLQNIATNAHQQKAVNDWAAAVQNENVLCFGSVFPFSDDAVEELYRIRKLGLRGIKLHPDYQGFFVEDKRLIPIYETISELKLPVLFHTGYDPISPDLYHAPPEAMQKIAKSFPDMIIIAAHMGGVYCYDEVEKYLVGLNIYLDTSMSSIFCESTQFERIVRNHGADRILFGSDLSVGLPGP